MQSFKTLIQKNILYIFGAIAGAIGGFFYWKTIGCISGTCKITSSPINSTLYFALLGSLIFSLFKKNK
ncbi:MAG: hypothetical protein ACO3AW_00820 [Chitinophagaceae bacterium]